MRVKEALDNIDTLDDVEVEFSRINYFNINTTDDSFVSSVLAYAEAYIHEESSEFDKK